MNNYFCVLPFFGYEYYPSNNGKHCCLLPKNYDINQIRQDILNKTRSPSCQACWSIEDNGLTSDRMLKNSALDYYRNKDIRVIEQEVQKGQYEPILIKHVTSNKCNATCVTCNPGGSTAWGSLEKKNKTINIIPKFRIDQSAIDSLRYDKLVGLNFIGGEPLWEESNFYMLEKLIAANNTNCFISFTTNGSTIISKENKLLLSKFKNVNIGLSVDGVGPVFDYIRYPLQWSKLLENLKFFRSITDNISVNSCTSNINVLYHHEVFNWCSSENLNYHFNPVQNPSHFRPSALPKPVKEKILNLYNTKNLKLFISADHTKKDDADFKSGMSELIRQDRLKGIDFKNYLPEFYELIKPFYFV